MKPPKILNLITDIVLGYTPKAKTEGAKKRVKKRRTIKRKKARE